MILFLHIVIVLLFLLRILSRENMTASTRLAWFVVILVLPILGLIVYYLFGEVRLGSTNSLKAKNVYSDLQNRFREVLTIDGQSDSTPDPLYAPAFAYASSMNGFHVRSGNKAELMPDDQTARSRLIQDIDAAQSSVNILYYIWFDDDTGAEVANALIRAVKRGVTCRAMVDALGSRAFIKSKLWKEMSLAGIQTAIALPYSNLLNTVLTSRLDLRNHRKITVIDNQITYCGSQNCTDPEFRTKPKYAPWVDILLRFEGPLVAQNQLLFASDWLRHVPEDADNFCPKIELKPKGFQALVWADGPSIRPSATPQFFATLLGMARNKVVITTPYFVPGEVVLNALCAAAYRGVDVSLIVPARNDSWIVAAASRSHYRELLSAGIKVFEYEKGLLHAKTLTLDGQLSLVGSTNLDLRSFDLNYENNILLQDAELTEEIFERQLEYILDSRELSLNEINDWSLLKRIWQNCIATVGPIL